MCRPRYTFRPVPELAQEYGFTLQAPRRRSQLSPKRVRRRRSSQRWVVERTHSWISRFRRLLVRWEKREDTYVAMLHFALGIITWFHSLYRKGSKTVPRIKQPKRFPQYLKAEEVPLMLTALERRWRSLFTTAVFTGMRKGELLALRKSDVALKTGTLRVGCPLCQGE
ncbi:hypothetical protein D7Y23_33280 [Corallococcus sp. AB050B]|nr:hypothetical protein D7Y23_33280 [Corallococcus sp. AB050B]